MPQIALPEATIDYREVGPQDSPHPPVLFVHGALVDSRLWDGPAELLAAQGFRCVLPTLPLGSHTIPVNDATALSMPGVAAMISGFVEALGLDDVTLVGNDTGGGICQFVVDSYPDRIGRLVLTNCDAFDKCPPFPFSTIFRLMQRPSAVKLLIGPMSSTALRHSVVGYGLLVRHPDAALTRSWLQPAGADPRIRRDMAALARSITGTDLTELGGRLRRFDKPVTLVWGQRDRCFTPALGRRVAAAFPRATLIEVPDATTFVALDAPRAVADAIAAVGTRAADLDTGR